MQCPFGMDPRGLQFSLKLFSPETPMKMQLLDNNEDKWG